VSAMISWVARQPEALLDKKGDPRVGMVGGSYGGGIQLVSAAIDHRIDAIVPDIAWHSLKTSLDKNDTAKSGWGIPLYAPRLSFTYKGTAPQANARVLAQVLDRSTGKVLDNQITPTVVRLDGRRHSVSLPLEIITATAGRDSSFALQLVAQSVLYNAHPQGGSITFSNVRVSVPLVRPV
jgi:hypothetical protein